LSGVSLLIELLMISVWTGERTTERYITQYLKHCFPLIPDYGIRFVSITIHTAVCVFWKMDIVVHKYSVVLLQPNI